VKDFQKNWQDLIKPKRIEKEEKSSSPFYAKFVCEPLERGYDGPIKMLVGMDTAGVLRGIIVTENREPYGYFSVDLPEFAEQFEGKNIRDPFRVGEDIDAITRATISVRSASRAVRNSSRRVARAELAPPEQ